MDGTARQSLNCHEDNEITYAGSFRCPFKSALFVLEVSRKHRPRKHRPRNLKRVLRPTHNSLPMALIIARLIK